MRVFIGCSASDRVDKKYKDLAIEVSTLIAKRGHKLVFGGFDQGMMGSCFMTFKYEGGKVKGIGHLRDAKVMQDMELDAYEVVNTTFDRVKELYSSSELIVVLPGGIGSLAEFFGMLDELRTIEDKKRIILFDYDNFYQPVLKMLEEMHKQRFVSDSDLKLINVVRNVDSLKKYLDVIEGEK